MATLLDMLWMDSILHHFETMPNHCLLAFAGESLFQGFFGANWILCIHMSGARSAFVWLPCGATPNSSPGRLGASTEPSFAEALRQAGAGACSDGAERSLRAGHGAADFWTEAGATCDFFFFFRRSPFFPDEFGKPPKSILHVWAGGGEEVQTCLSPTLCSKKPTSIQPMSIYCLTQLKYNQTKAYQ